jgi:DNA-binding MarR family transcriptional regulator
MNNIGYLLMKVSKELRYNLTTELKSFGLTASQWAVMKRLEMEEFYSSPLYARTAVELASILDFDKPTISGIINRLYEKGMIKKEKHPNDGRSVILYLTEEAREIIPTIEMISNQVIEQSFISFTSEESEIFLFLLKKLDNTLIEGKRP